MQVIVHRSRGGPITKRHMLCDANGEPLSFLLSGGQASDISYAQPLLDDVSMKRRMRLGVVGGLALAPQSSLS